MAALPEPSREAAERILAAVAAPAAQVAKGPAQAFESVRIDLGEREASCPEHGSFTSRGMGLRLTGVVREVWGQCQACQRDRQAREEAEATAQAAHQAMARQAEMLGASAIPARFHGRTFDTFLADTDDKAAALRVAREFAQGFDRHREAGRGLIFSGKPGTGKSHLAASIMLHLMPRHRALYTTCMGAIRMVRDTWRKDCPTTERAVLRLLGDEIDLLVIDEVGVQYGTDGEQTLLFEILDRRYSGLRPTILITNQDRDGLAAYVGPRVMDRLRETARWVAFTWESRRPAMREAAK